MDGPKVEFSTHLLTSFAGFSCHGSWREPDHLRGGHHEYLIVKEAATSPSGRRLCARISENGGGFGVSAASAGGSGLNVSLVASDRDCPRPDVSADSDTVWDFSLSRASKQIIWNLFFKMAKKAKR